MSRKLRSLLSAMVLAAIAMTAWAAGRAAAQDVPPKEGAAVKTEATAKTAPADKGDKADTSLREQNIYIPYQKLRQVFEKHGRGVFLPYEEFEKLWQAAQDKTRPAAEPAPPVGALITEIENEATVAKDVVRVKALVKIDVLAEGWNEVPLRLADAAISSASIRGEPARILGDAAQGYRLLVEKKGKQPETIELALEYAKAIARTPGQNSVAFQSPQTPVSRWRVRIPQSGVKVQIEPLIAFTEQPSAEKPGEKDKPDAKKADETVVLAFVGAAPMIRIQWTPKAEGATGLAALASVQTEQQVWIHEGVTRTRAVLKYTISRAELAQLSFEVPADYKVVNISDANVRQWSVEPRAADAKVQKITAQLFQPAKDTQQVVVELEKYTGTERLEKLVTPMIQALDVGRQEGVLVVSVAQALRAEAAHAKGLEQRDRNDLPPGLAGGNWAFSYRYATVPYELELTLEEVKPRITADSLVEAQLEPERLTLDMTAVYTIERAGVFKLELDVPEGFEVRQVRGRDSRVGDAARDASAVQVESHRLEGEKKTRLVVNLARKATGRVALAVQLHKDLSEPDLKTPTGKAAAIPLPLPQVAKESVERAAGRLVVYAPEGLRVNPSKSDGLRSVTFKEALEGMTSAREPRAAAAARPVLAFAFTQEPVTAQLAAERRKPQVTVRQLLVARIEEGVVKYQATFFHTVLYSGVKSLRIDLPNDVAAIAQNNSRNVAREKVMDPPPADLAKDCVAWSFSGDAEFLGEGRIELTWEKKIEKLEVRKSMPLAVPRLVPRQVDRAWGQIVLAKAESLDVQPAAELKGLRPIDPQHDLIEPVPGAASALEFHGDWTLPLALTRYEVQDVQRTSIDRAVVRQVVTPAGTIAVQALYLMRSAEQKLTIALPASASFDTDPLRLNNKPAPLEKGQNEGEYKVGLVGTNPDEPFLLELRYTVPGSRRLDLPEFPDGAAVQEVYLCAYLPETQALLGSTGPWTEKFGWVRSRGRCRPLHPDLSGGLSYDEGLVQWVASGARLTGPVGKFPTDGQLYVFSTLRPAKSPDGALSLATMDARWLNAIVFALVLGGGLLLLPVRLARRALIIGVGLVALVLAGVFLPTFSLQILNGVLLLALFLVAAVWATSYAAFTLPAILAHRRAAAAQPPQNEAVSAVAVEVPSAEAPKTEEGGPSHA